MITKSMLAHKDIGYTPGCRKCYMLQRGDNSYPGLGHTANCRARVEAKMTENPELAKKLERARQREQEYHERMVEAGDTREDAKAKTGEEVLRDRPHKVNILEVLLLFR